jgi:hypothetical protein
MVILPHKVGSPDILRVNSAAVAKRYRPFFDDFVERYPYARRLAETSRGK